MSDIHDSYFAACSQLVRRYGEATGGRAHAALMPCEAGGVSLAYLEQTTPKTGLEPEFTIVSEDTMSLMRALDSLTLSLAHAIEANCRGLALAAIRIGEPQALKGVVALEMYCPAWGGTTALFCRYSADMSPDQMSVTLYPMQRAELSDEQGAGWDYMYSAGVVGELPRVLPWIAQGVAQLLFLNRTTELDICTVLLPGLHRAQSAFPADSIVLAGFPSGGPAWQLSTRGPRLHVDSEPGAVALTSMQRSELTLAMARWQAMCEALAEQRDMQPQAEATAAGD